MGAGTAAARCMSAWCQLEAMSSLREIIPRARQWNIIHRRSTNKLHSAFPASQGSLFHLPQSAPTGIFTPAAASPAPLTQQLHLQTIVRLSRHGSPSVIRPAGGIAVRFRSERHQLEHFQPVQQPWRCLRPDISPEVPFTMG